MKHEPTFSAPVGTAVGADGLSIAQRRFVEAYVDCLNASEAARRAGYSVKTAGFQGSALLKRPQIRQAIADLVADRAEVTRSLLIEELSAVAMTNAGELFSWDQGEELREVLDDGSVVIREVAKVHLRSSKELTRRQLAAVKSITEKIGSDGRRSVELQMNDKLRAVELLGRALGMFGNGEGGVSINIGTRPVSEVAVTYADDPQTIDGTAHEVPNANKRK